MWASKFLNDENGILQRAIGFTTEPLDEAFELCALYATSSNFTLGTSKFWIILGACFLGSVVSEKYCGVL